MNVDQFDRVLWVATLISVLAVLAVVGIGFARTLAETQAAMDRAEAALTEAQAATERLQRVTERLDRRETERADEFEQRELGRCRDRNTAQRFTRRAIRTLVLALEELGGREEAIRVLLASVPDADEQDVDCDGDGRLTGNDYANVQRDIDLPSPFARDPVVAVDVPAEPVRAAGTAEPEEPPEPTVDSEPTVDPSPARDPPDPEARPGPPRPRHEPDREQTDRGPPPDDRHPACEATRPRPGTPPFCPDDEPPP